MSKNAVNTQDAAVADAVSRTELFFENNGRKVVLAVVAAVLIVVCGYAYKKLVVDRNAERASELIVEAQYRFDGENPDYALALNGDDNGAGFLDVAEQYGSTPAGNLAKHYAGVCYLKLGDSGNAEKYLSAYKPVDGIPGAVINAQNIGLRGDIAVDRGDYAGAAALFAKAAAVSENNFTAPLYLYKQGLALIAADRKADALECFEEIEAKYPSSIEARDAEKLIGSIKE